MPDVGSTWLLSRAPGELGTHAALSAATLAAGDTIALGLADHFVPSRRLADLVAGLEADSATEVVERFCEPAPDSELLARQQEIDAIYGDDDLERIAAHLAGERLCPTSIVLTHQLLRAAAIADLRTCLDRELRAALWLHARPDLTEGVRAQIIDKDRRPRWSPSNLEEVEVPERLRG